LKQAFARGLVLAPTLLVVALDVGLRGHQLHEFTREAWIGYEWAAAIGMVAWAALVLAAATRSGPTRWIARAMLAALALLAVGTQLQTWARYHAYLNWRTALMGNSLWPCLAQQLWGDGLWVLALLLLPVIVALGIAALLARLAPPKPWVAAVATPVAIVALAAAAIYGNPDAGWDSGTTPDVLWLAAGGALAKSMRTQEDVMVTLAHLPGARSPETVPTLHAAPPRPRSVLVLLDESVRASDVCSVPADDDGECEKTPFTNRALPGRLGFTQMRSLDSTTSLSMATLLTGHSPDEPRATLLGVPSLFEYAHAAGVDAGFWTSQNLLYANAGRFLDGAPMSVFVSGTELEPYADYLDGADDAKLLARVAADVPRLHEPYFALVQLANTHFPYKVDEHDLPFSSTRDWHKMDSFGRTAVRYADALHRQDKILARFLQTLRRERTVVLFVSDHGEQIGEHRRTGHTWSEWDVELHVPMWIDAPPGALTDGETAQLRSLRDTRLTMLDLAPTVLDLLGVWDDPGLAGWRSHVPGVSMLRAAPPADRAVVMTNCSAIFSCSSPNWGAMRGPLKLFAGEGEHAWHCFDVAADPDEEHDLGADACGDLRAIAEGAGRGTPFD
jgi:glucan phosphoethanolaminetransferase (alkaline phosphatase superfamily)